MTTETADSPMIETTNLCMTYRSGKIEVAALNNINLTIGRGEFVAIMGPSGCGKSTLLHLLGGLVHPTSGVIRIDGEDVSKLSDADRTTLRRKKIGYIFQRFNLLTTISARANIELAKKIQGNGKPGLNGAAPIIEMLGLKEKMHFRPTELSGGEQQRVAVARALMNNPSVILADEPSGNLDTQNKKELHDLFFDLRNKLDQTFVIVTHDNELAGMSDRTITMHDGLLVG